MSTFLTKQKKEASSTTLHVNIKKLLAVTRSVMKELGLLESCSRFEKYISKIIIGNCYVYGDKTKKVFRLPRERDELFDYLKQDNLEKEIVVKLSHVATCLCVGNNQMYTLQHKH
jgi:hypothetical protein